MSRPPSATILWTSAVVLGLCAVAAPFMALAPLDRAAPAPAASSLGPDRSPVTAPAPLPSPAAFAPLLARSYRQPLTDPKPVVPAPVEPAALMSGRLPVRLTGTILEEGRSIAVFATDLAKIEMRGEGESIAGAEVVAIAPDHVTLRVNGRNKVLKVQREQAGPAGVAPALSQSQTPAP